MDTTRNPRLLTHDERKAAEAAFAGRPCNPLWSESAKKIYEGLIGALPVLPDEPSEASHQIQADPDGSEIPKTASAMPRERESNVQNPDKPDEASMVQGQTPVPQSITNRAEAIQAGFLIDVTADAQKLGLTFSVTITKPLWEIGIAPGEELSEKDKAERLRDVLMAFRLRLAGQSTLSPLIDFPAMLALPPGGVPQPVPLFALIQPDEQNRAAATLLLPNEVSTTIIPMK